MTSNQAGLNILRLPRARLPLFLAVFIDIFSFGLMYPLIVGLFHTGWIAHFYSPAARDGFLSLAFSLFPIGMFFGASLLGDLSDALGRRRTLMICMAGLAGSYALMWASLELHIVWLFLVGRLASGLMAGTAPIAQAAMMDTAPPDQRAAAMAQVTLVNTFGFVIGPAIGGLLGHLDFRLPIGVALILCLLTLATLGSTTLSGDKPKKRFSFDWREPFLLFARMRGRPALITAVAAFFLFQFGYMIYYTFILIVMQRQYGFSTAQVGLFAMVMGVGCVIGTAFGYKLAVRFLGDDTRVAKASLAACGLVVAVTALPMPAAAQVVLTLVAAITNLPAFVTLLAAIASGVEATEQGWALGIGTASIALSVFAAGLLSSLLSIIPGAAFLALGGLLILCSLVPARRLAATVNAALPTEGSAA